MNYNQKHIATGFQATMPKKHHHIENYIVSHFNSLNARIIFESVADIQGFDNDGDKVIGEFKSEKEHIKNYSWWSDWKGRLENTYSQNLSTMLPKNKRWLAVIDGQLREYCDLEGIDNGYLVVEKYIQVNDDIIKSLNFLISEGKIKGFISPTSDCKGLGYYKIIY